MHFEALEQTLCLRLVSRPVDKKFFLFSRNSLSRTVCVPAVPRPYRRTRACRRRGAVAAAGARGGGVLERTPHARRVHVRNGAAPAVLRTGGDPRAPFPGPRDLERGGSVTAPPVRQRPHEQRHSSRNESGVATAHHHAPLPSRCSAGARLSWLREAVVRGSLRALAGCSSSSRPADDISSSATSVYSARRSSQHASVTIRLQADWLVAVLHLL